MSCRVALGNWFGLEVSAKPRALLWGALLVIVLIPIGMFVLHLSALEAVMGAVLCTVISFLSDFVHHLGHAYAARRTGYPMRGVYFVGLIALSQYPRDEPPLPGKIHLRRASGGPITSALVTLVWLGVVLLTQAGGGVLYWVAVFAFLENLLVMTLGSLLPLPFTDGGTFVKWWGKP